MPSKKSSRRTATPVGIREHTLVSTFSKYMSEYIADKDKHALEEASSLGEDLPPQVDANVLTKLTSHVKELETRIKKLQFYDIRSSSQRDRHLDRISSILEDDLKDLETFQTDGFEELQKVAALCTHFVSQ